MGESLFQEELAGPGAEGAGVHHTEAMVEHLARSRPWVVFLSVLGFLLAGVAFVLMAILFSMVALGVGPSGSTAPGDQLLGVLASVACGFVGVASAFFSVLLQRCSRALGQLAASDRTADLELALEAQRVFFRSVGIVAIVWVGLVVLGIVVMVVLSLTNSSFL